ncbi:MAG: PDZ domain-containing protein [Magnetococcales bacterium]|nr:PDZ domain-containing protein [Magnetococcales bacterium]
MKFPVILLCLTLLAPVTFRAARAGGWLGATVFPPHGVEIGDIIKESPADKAGLRRGDVIRKLNGQLIHSIPQFVETIRQTSPGTGVELEIHRSGEEHHLKVVLDDTSRHPDTWATPPGDVFIPFAPPGMALPQ